MTNKLDNGHFQVLKRSKLFSYINSKYTDKKQSKMAKEMGNNEQNESKWPKKWPNMTIFESSNGKNDPMYTKNKYTNQKLPKKPKKRPINHPKVTKNIPNCQKLSK